MNFILGNRLNKYTNDKRKLTAIISIAVMIILAIILLRKNYKIAYKVTLDGSVLGYIDNKEEFTCMVTNQVLNQNNENMELIVLNKVPQYSLSVINKNTNTNEESIIKTLKLKADVTYKLYAITLAGEDKAYVNTLEEAQQKVNELTEKYKDNSEFGIREVYTNNLIEYKNMKYATITKLDNTLIAEQQAKEEAKKEEARKAEKAKKAAKATVAQNNYVSVESQSLSDTYVNGIAFTVSPVTGRISSRYGVNESIRNHTHAGLDIAASNGTTIYAVADGVVTYAQFNNGGYGNLVKISHGNGVETYYAHCSKLYVSEGQTVKAGTAIAAVGSTGYSTGNHLHFEIRIDGATVNPQKYLYN